MCGCDCRALQLFRCMIKKRKDSRVKTRGSIKTKAIGTTGKRYASPESLLDMDGIRQLRRDCLAFLLDLGKLTVSVTALIATLGKALEKSSQRSMDIKDINPNRRLITTTYAPNVSENATVKALRSFDGHLGVLQDGQTRKSLKK